MKRITALLHWTITLSLPLFLGFGTICLVVSPAFLRWEYSKPTFPPDRYGLTREQRLELGSVAVEFLRLRERPETAIRLLEAQTLDGGPLYNQRELDHMVDTKKRTDVIRTVAWIAGAAVVGGTLMLAWRAELGGASAARRALFSGSVATICVLGAISAYILLGWDSFFTRFHELLFPPGTWTFAYSDSLIRLFPERFWFDVGVLIGVGTLAEAVAVGALSYWRARRN